jgi:hypothetical protein
MMKNMSYVLAAFLLVSCADVGYYHNRHGDTVVIEPVDLWGTVTFFDPVGHRIDLDYDDGGVRRTRSIYYDEHATRWDGVQYSEIHKGDAIKVHGHKDHDRWTAESVSRHEH